MNIPATAVAMMLSVQALFTATVGETEIDTVKFETAESIKQIIEPIEVNEPDYTVLELQFGAEEYEAVADDTGSDSEVDNPSVGGACFIDREPIRTEHLWSESVTITHYCACSACCGKWAGGGTASGTIPAAGRTVACGDLPFGTRIRIEGLDGEYVVEDRGVSGFWIDIFCDSHQEALNRGMYTAKVWIVEE